MRLIDADALLDKQESLYMKGNVLFHGVTACAIENAPTIDPEALPIVRELREKLERVTEERDAAIFDLRESAGCDHCANGCANTETEYCLACDNTECKCRGCLNGENWEWRGLVAENAIAESEPKPRWKELAALQPLDGVGTKEGAGKNCVPGYPPQKACCSDCKNANNPEKRLIAGQEKPISTFRSGFEKKGERQWMNPEKK